MLVLSRKCDQSIVIGENVVIRVTKLSRNRVTVSINAPDEIKIRRGELDELPRENIDVLV